MSIRIGFTGTQKGMTEAQKKTFTEIISQYTSLEFHHGDCIGADEEAHKIVLKTKKAVITIHPPDDSIKRAFCSGDKVLPPFPYLTRNKHIVQNSDYLIATPKEDKEVLRSGTWSTIRYAKKLGLQVMIIFPDGGVIDFVKNLKVC